jgi:hypothetical protein
MPRRSNFIIPFVAIRNLARAGRFGPDCESEIENEVDVIFSAIGGEGASAGGGDRSPRPDAPAERDPAPWSVAHALSRFGPFAARVIESAVEKERQVSPPCGPLDEVSYDLRDVVSQILPSDRGRWYRDPLDVLCDLQERLIETIKITDLGRLRFCEVCNKMFYARHPLMLACCPSHSHRIRQHNYYRRHHGPRRVRRRRTRTR